MSVQYLKAIKILNGKEMKVRRFKVLHIPLTKKEANHIISVINKRYLNNFKRCYLDLSETK